MRRGFATAIAIALASCGEPPEVSAALVLPANIAGEVARVHILFALSDQVSCSAYNNAPGGCYKAADFGKVAKSGSFAFSVAAGASGEKTFNVSGVTPGRNYSVIVEAADGAGTLTARGCAVTNAQVRPGSNEAVTVLLVEWSGGACAPGT